MWTKLRTVAGSPPLVLGVADVGEICRRAIAAPGVGGVRSRVDYRPQAHRERSGRWDSSRLALALSLLLEDAVASSPRDDRVELSWLVHDDEAVIRVHYARPLEPGDRLVTFFDDALDHGPRATARERLREARDIVLRHGGTLARVRTRRGTTYVVSLPRGMSRVGSESPNSPVHREAAVTLG